MLVVAFEQGAASAAEIAAALAADTPLAFLVPESPYTQRLRPVLAELGTVVPLTGGDEDVERLRALRPTGIVTYTEPLLRDTARLTTALGLPGHSVATVGLLTDKLRQRGRLAEAGVDSVRQHVVRGPEDWPAAVAAVGLPAVVKPLYGGGSRDTYLVEDEATALRLSGTMTGELVLEEYLRGRPSLPYGDFVSVESLCSPDGVTHVAVTGKLPMLPPFRESGQLWPADLPAGELAAITDLATRTLLALGVDFGITHTEIKLTPDGPRVIEVNGRLGGLINDLYRTSAGLDMVRIGGLQAMGEPVSAKPPVPDRVHFQYWGSAPIRRSQLLGVPGARTVRRVKGISGYRSFVRPGQWITSGVMTCRLDMIWGDTEDHPAMFAALDEALAQVSYEFRFDSGETVTLPPPRPWATSDRAPGEPS